MRVSTVLLALILAFLTSREFSISADDPKGKDLKDKKSSIEAAEEEVFKALDGKVKVPNASSALVPVKLEVIRLAEIGKDIYIGVAAIRRDDESGQGVAWELPVHAFRINGKIEASTESPSALTRATYRDRIISIRAIIAAQRK